MELVWGPMLAVGQGPMPEPASDDATLMALYAGGDGRAFEILTAAIAARSIATSRGCARGDAEAIFQDVWMAVIRGRDRYEPSARFSTFLFSIAHRRVIDSRRRDRGDRCHSRRDADTMRDPARLAEGAALGQAADRGTGQPAARTARSLLAAGGRRAERARNRGCDGRRLRDRQEPSEILPPRLARETGRLEVTGEDDDSDLLQLYRAKRANCRLRRWMRKSWRPRGRDGAGGCGLLRAAAAAVPGAGFRPLRHEPQTQPTGGRYVPGGLYDGQAAQQLADPQLMRQQAIMQMPGGSDGGKSNGL